MVIALVSSNLSINFSSTWLIYHVLPKNILTSTFIQYLDTNYKHKLTFYNVNQPTN